jgi:hypothetical protein
MLVVFNDVSTYFYVIKCINKIVIGSNDETFEKLNKRCPLTERAPTSSMLERNRTEQAVYQGSLINQNTVAVSYREL